MSDTSDGEIDVIQERAQMLLEQRLRAVRASMARDPEDLTEERLCEGCGEPIPQRRLLAVPWASRCVHCQASEEGR